MKIARVLQGSRFSDDPLSQSGMKIEPDWKTRLAWWLIGPNRVLPKSEDERATRCLQIAARYWTCGAPNGEARRLQRTWQREGRRRAERIGGRA